MRSPLVAVLAALPILAAAQTPKDIAHQIWPSGAPASSATAPRQQTAFAGFNHGIATEIWLQRAPVIDQAKPDQASVRFQYAGTFMPSDLARLRDGSGDRAVHPVSPDPYLAALLLPAGR